MYENLANHLYERALAPPQRATEDEARPEEKRRRTVRRETRQSVVLYMIDRRRAVSGYTVDVTKDTLGVYSPEYVEPGSLVRVRGINRYSEWSLGFVAACTELSGICRIGVQLFSLEWSQSTTRLHPSLPDDIRELVAEEIALQSERENAQ